MLKKAANYLSFSILSAIIGFLAVIYMSRVISQEEMGVIGLFMGALYIAPELIAFSTTPLCQDRSPVS